MPTRQSLAIWPSAPQLLRAAALQSLVKLAPRSLIRNPVIFSTALVSLAPTILAVRDGVTGTGNFGFGIQIAVWLWFTVLFANFAEAIAEGRGKARADAFRATKSTARARVLIDAERPDLFKYKDADTLEPGHLIH